jgi:hypothetical protein
MTHTELKNLLNDIWNDFAAGKITRAGFNAMNQSAMNRWLKSSLGVK